VTTVGGPVYEGERASAIEEGGARRRRVVCGGGAREGQRKSGGAGLALAGDEEATAARSDKSAGDGDRRRGLAGVGVRWRRRGGLGAVGRVEDDGSGEWTPMPCVDATALGLAIVWI